MNIAQIKKDKHTIYFGPESVSMHLGIPLNAASPPRGGHARRLVEGILLLDDKYHSVVIQTGKLFTYYVVVVVR